MAANDIKTRMMKARSLIQQGEYVRARKLLQTVDHPKAREWLLKLEARLQEADIDRIPDPDFSPERRKRKRMPPPQPAVEVTKSKKKRGGCQRVFNLAKTVLVAFILVIAGILFLADSGDSSTISNSGPKPFDRTEYIEDIHSAMQYSGVPEWQVIVFDGRPGGERYVKVTYNTNKDTETDILIRLADVYDSVGRAINRDGLVFDRVYVTVMDPLGWEAMATSASPSTVEMLYEGVLERDDLLSLLSVHN